jgi:OFA family oxalate/formate antiporter-like MFS transporter
MQVFGVFLVPLTTEFGWGRGALSGAYSASFLLSGFLGIIAGRFSDKYGPRILLTVSGLLMGIGLLLMSYINSLWQVYLVWGLVVGVGWGSCLIPVISTIPRWFEEKRGLATGIAVSGIGIGGIIWPLLAQWLISAYGWQRAFFILGLIIFAIIIPLAQFMKHSPERTGVKAYGEAGTVIDEQSSALNGGFSFNQVIRTSRFWMLGLLHFCFLFSVHVLIVHIVPYAVRIGFSAAVAASILSVIAGSSVFGRLAIGFVSDKIGGRLAMSACLIIATLALIWLQFAQEAWMLYIFAVVFGLAWGGMVPLGTVVTAGLFGLKSLGAILGSILLIGTMGGGVGTPLAGTIFDITESYSLAFSICAALGALAIIFSVILIRYKVKGSGVQVYKF